MLILTALVCNCCIKYEFGQFGPPHSGPSPFYPTYKIIQRHILIQYVDNRYSFKTIHSINVTQSNYLMFVHNFERTF